MKNVREELPTFKIVVELAIRSFKRKGNGFIELKAWFIYLRKRENIQI